MPSNKTHTRTSACPSACLPVSPTLADTLDHVMQQVEYHCFADLRTRYIDPLYKELCLIVSEVYFMLPESVIKINGSPMPVRFVQEVFRQLRNAHIKRVFENFTEVTCFIYNKKAYLRTALYNAFFELESGFVVCPHNAC